MQPFRIWFISLCGVLYGVPIPNEQAQAVAQTNSVTVLNSVDCLSMGRKRMLVLSKETGESTIEHPFRHKKFSVCYRLHQYDPQGYNAEATPEALIWQRCVAYDTAAHPLPQWTIGLDWGLGSSNDAYLAFAHTSASRLLTVSLYAISPDSKIDVNSPPMEPVGEFKKQLPTSSRSVSTIRMEVVSTQLVIFLERKVGKERHDRWPTICLRFDLETKKWTEVNLFGERVDAERWVPGLMK